MQTTSTYFDNLATSEVRPISWRLSISFDKTFDDNIGFFVIGTSSLDGPDVLVPDDNEVIQEWDKYEYTDYSDRVISIEVTREELEPHSVVQAMADVTLDNHDDFFTPNSGSTIEDYILPKRPVRILLGFGGSNLPQFIGLTDRMPVIDKSGRTARFHMTDFLSYLFTKKIEDTEMLTDVTTGEALTYIFEEAGLLSSQLDFTSTSFNRIPFFFVEKDQTLGDVVRKLMEAEQGRLFMDEFGVIKFQNRQDYATTPVAALNESNTINYDTSGQDDIINFVELNSKILEAQQLQSVWQSSEATLVKAGSTATIWASLRDPITSVVSPTYSAKVATTSYFISTLDANGTIANANIDLNTLTQFAKSVKLVFENTGLTDAYVYSVDLWGVPVKEIDTINVKDFDQDSIDKYDEQRYTLDTSYIQDRTTAESKAAILLDDYKDLGSILDVDVKGNMAYQIGDPVAVSLDGYTQDHVITRIVQVMQGGGYHQRLRIKARTPREYFIIGTSALDGTAVLAP